MKFKSGTFYHDSVQFTLMCQIVDPFINPGREWCRKNFFRRAYSAPMVLVVGLSFFLCESNYRGKYFSEKNGSSGFRSRDIDILLGDNQ